MIVSQPMLRLRTTAKDGAFPASSRCTPNPVRLATPRTLATTPRSRLRSLPSCRAWRGRRMQFQDVRSVWSLHAMCVAELNFGSTICGSKYLYQFVGIYQYENCRMSLGALSTEGAVQSFLFKIIYPTHAHMYLYIYTRIIVFLVEPLEEHIYLWKDGRRRPFSVSCSWGWYCSFPTTVCWLASVCVCVLLPFAVCMILSKCIWFFKVWIMVSHFSRISVFHVWLECCHSPWPQAP